MPSAGPVAPFFPFIPEPCPLALSRGLRPSPAAPSGVSEASDLMNSEEAIEWPAESGAWPKDDDEVRWVGVEVSGFEGVVKGWVEVGGGPWG